MLSFSASSHPLFLHMRGWTCCLVHAKKWSWLWVSLLFSFRDKFLWICVILSNYLFHGWCKQFLDNVSISGPYPPSSYPLSLSVIFSHHPDVSISCHTPRQQHRLKFGYFQTQLFTFRLFLKFPSSSLLSLWTPLTGLLPRSQLTSRLLKLSHFLALSLFIQ